MANRWFKVELYLLWLVLAVAAVFFAAQLLDITNLLEERYPNLGTSGWILIIGWFSVGILMAPFAMNLCRKRMRRDCYLEGAAGSGLYFFFSAVIYLSLNWRW